MYFIHLRFWFARGFWGYFDSILSMAASSREDALLAHFMHREEKSLPRTKTIGAANVPFLLVEFLPHTPHFSCEALTTLTDDFLLHSGHDSQVPGVCRQELPSSAMPVIFQQTSRAAGLTLVLMAIETP